MMLSVKHLVHLHMILVTLKTFIEQVINTQTDKKLLFMYCQKLAIFVLFYHDVHYIVHVYLKETLYCYITVC